MSGLLDGLTQQLGSDGTSRLAAKLGVDEQAMGGLLSAALPALIGGMANNTSKPEGASALSAALDDHDPSLLGNLGSLLGGGGPGDAILGHVLGSRRPAVEQNLASTTGVPTSTVAKLLPLLAPMVMAYLAKEKKEKALDERSLGSLLGEERKAAERRQPGLGGLASILDSDGDGSILDDVIDLASGAGGAKGGSKGGLGGLLGKVLGR